MRLMDRLRQWMVGRYGSDQLNIALLVLYLISSIVLSLTGWFPVLILGYLLFVLIFFRMFSRNIPKRYAENQKFLKIWNPIRNKFPKSKSRTNSGYYGQNPYGNPYGATQKPRKKSKPKADKNHKIFQCGKCGQMIRVPKGKGKIAITCPNCRQEFIKRT